MDVLRSLRSCGLRVDLVHPDRALLLVPEPPAGWRDHVRVELGGWLCVYMEEALADLPVGVTIVVRPEGDPSLIVAWDDPDDGEPPLPDDDDLLPAATALADLAQQVIARSYEKALRRAKSSVDAYYRDGDGCSDCMNGVPLPARFLLAGDLVTETDTPEGPFYEVIEVDKRASVLVLDVGDEDGLPVALAVDMEAAVWIKPSGPPAH